MTDPSRRRKTRRRLLIPGALLVIIPALLLLTFYFISSAGPRESLRLRVDKLRDEAKSRKLSRTVLHGPTTPGNAWDEYVVAIKDAEGWKEDPNGAILAKFFEGSETTAERAIAAQMIKDHGAVLGYLRRGVQKENGQMPNQWVPPFEIPNMLGARKLSNLAGAQVRTLSESGRSVDAVELALDMTVFARDVAGNGAILTDLIGKNLYEDAASALRTAMLSGKLTARDFEALATSLESVEQDFPAQSTAFRNETMANGVSLIQWADEVASSEWRKSIAEGGLLYKLSSRIYANDYIESSLAFMEKTQNFDGMDYAAAMKEAEALETLAAKSNNPLISTTFGSLRRVITCHREVLAKFRLLRASAVWAATGSVPKIADPLGGELRWKEDDGKLRIWTVGGDGKDDEGQGDWSRAKNDIVLELPKAVVAKAAVVRTPGQAGRER